MTMALAWPASLVPSSEMWAIDAGTRGGGASIEGRDQVVSSGLGLWRASLEIPMTPVNRRAYRALIASLGGRAGRVLVGPCGCVDGPTVVSSDLTGIPYSDGAFHSDDAGFATLAALVSTVNGAAAAGATSMNVARGTVYDIQPGQYFGVGGYLYQITTMVGGEGDDFLMTFAPRLRAAADDGAEIEWCAPVCPMRLVSDDVGAIELAFSRFGSARLDFIEVFGG